MSSASDDSQKKVNFKSNEEAEKKTTDENESEGKESESSGYSVKVAVPKKSYGSAKKNSSQYTGLSFIPLNLFQQLKNPVFQFYILIMILEVVPGVSVTDQLPRTLYPYLIVMIVQMTVDYLITFKVNNMDNIQNNMKVQTIQTF
jgi:hypothetical protein